MRATLNIPGVLSDVYTPAKWQMVWAVIDDLPALMNKVFASESGYNSTKTGKCQ
ncbi:hypothetical protein OS493_039496, partial [Desmophyllum pertusum]